MEKRNLYIIVAVVLVAGLVLSFGNLTGRTVENCIDNDGGDNPHEPGVVSYATGELFKDECYAAGGIGKKKFLRERFCVEKVDSESYLCEGGCLEDEHGVGYCGEGEANLLDN